MDPKNKVENINNFKIPGSIYIFIKQLKRKKALRPAPKEIKILKIRDPKKYSTDSCL